jgi:hypothetical protein
LLLDYFIHRFAQKSGKKDSEYLKRNHRTLRKVRLAGQHSRTTEHC